MQLEWRDELRALLKESGVLKTPFFSVADSSVELLDWSTDPYRAMFEMATQTWGYSGKWSKASPRLRFEVVKLVLEKKALPLALEAPTFTFQVDNTTRAAFDQIARARVGVVLAARGFKDNDLSDEGFVIPAGLDDKDRLDVLTLVQSNKYAYARLRKKYPGWKARCLMQMGTRYNFIWSSTYLALQNLCSKRMCCIEEPSTVAVAWLMKKELAAKFPLLADYLRPLEAWKNKCVVKEMNGFSDILGVPHAECSGEKTVASEDSSSCTNVEELVAQLNVDPGFKNYSWETLDPRDRALFEKKWG